MARTSEVTARGRALDLGCGRDKLPGAIGIDANPRSDADIIHDLDVHPWPLESDSFDFVRAHDVLEHVADFGRAVDELYRVCRNGAVVHVRMPFTGGLHAGTDPTHRRGGMSRTFDYYDPNKQLGRYCYSTARFDLVRMHYERGYTRTTLSKLIRIADRVLIPLAERYPLDYESFFAGLYPMHNVCYELRVIKPRP